jgi:single-stranded-DNA-specific exonuclease
MAAGLQCSSTSFGVFAQQFIDVINELHPVSALIARKHYDCEATLADLSVDAIRSLDQLRPFGRDNPGIALLLRGLRIASRPEHLGKTNKHLAMLVQPADAPRSVAMRCIAWGKGELVPVLRMGQQIDVVARPKLNTFQGSTRPELEALDIAP